MSDAAKTLPEQIAAKVGQTEPKILYLLFYRQGNNPHPQFRFFYHQSKSMNVIAERAKRHCEVMSYRFVHVTPAIIDMDHAENCLTNREI